LHKKKEGPGGASLDLPSVGKRIMAGEAKSTIRKKGYLMKRVLLKTHAHRMNMSTQCDPVCKFICQ